MFAASPVADSETFVIRAPLSHEDGPACDFLLSTIATQVSSPFPAEVALPIPSNGSSQVLRDDNLRFCILASNKVIYHFDES